MMIFFVYSRCIFKLLFSPAVPLTEQYNREREKKHIHTTEQQLYRPSMKKMETFSLSYALLYVRHGYFRSRHHQ